MYIITIIRGLVEAMSESHNFRPFPFFTGKHTQTLVGTMFAFSFEPESETRFVDLPDGDKLALEYSTPEGWTNKQPTIFMLHGLCGSHKSTYLVRMARKLGRNGIRAIRMNLRGCGSGKGLSRNIYHSGCSDDLRAALEYVKREAPESDIILLGFSLGGNIVLKLAGELGLEKNDTLIKHVISVSPPVDLEASVQLLDADTNKIYSRYFMHHLLSEVEERHRFFPDIIMPKFPSPLSFYLFEKLYICPNAGFSSNSEYYDKCSSAPKVPWIKIPCHILFAKDDPIIDHRALENYTIPDNVKITITNHGGHMGFIGSPLDVGGFHWMDTTLMKWISETNGLELL